MKIIFDIGGTYTRVASIEGQDIGLVLKVTTPADVEIAKKTIIELIKKAAGENAVDSIVGGVPGIVRNGIILHAPNLKGWDGFDVASFLKDNFCKTVFVYNDGSLAGLGESVYGAGKGSDIVAYLGIGTGIGGARIVKGKIDIAHVGFEPGHHIVDMTHGKTFEDLVSGRAIKEVYKKSTEELGQTEVEKLVPMLAIGIYNALLFWSPDVLVIGGSLMNEETAFKIEDVKKSLKEIKTEIKLPEVRKASLGDNSGLYGALAVSLRL